MIIKYISPLGAGLKDGSTYDNAMPAVSGNNTWSVAFVSGCTIGTEYRVLPGNYTYTASIATTQFASGVWGSGYWFYGSDASGNRLTPVRLANGRLDSTNYPVFRPSGNTLFFNGAKTAVNFSCLKFFDLGTSTSSLLNPGGVNIIYGCEFIRNASSATTSMLDLTGGSNHIVNCDFIASGVLHAAILNDTASADFISDCLFFKAFSSSGGNAISGSFSNATITNCAFVNIPTHVIWNTSTAPVLTINNNIFYNTKGHAIVVTGVFTPAITTNRIAIFNCAFYNVSGYAFWQRPAKNTIKAYNNSFYNMGSGIYSHIPTNETTGYTLVGNNNDFFNPNILDMRYTPNNSLVGKGLLGRNLGFDQNKMNYGFAGGA